MSKRRLTVVAVFTALVLAACGGSVEDAADDGTAPEGTAVTETTVPGTVAQGDGIQVTAQDYVFNGVPETVAPGTSFALTNGSETEVHEIVIVRIASEETRTVEELLELSEEESEELTEFQGVLVALPGEDGRNPMGDGDSITVTEPGRYAVVCFIPQGADPAVVEEAMESADPSEEPPPLGDGTPHAFLGMVTEFSVEE